MFEIKAKSSTGESYQVEFKITDTIKVNCNCKAGNFGKLCKHKTGILSGDKTFLYDFAEESKLKEIIEIVKGSEYFRLVDELILAEKAVVSAKKYEDKVKGKLELALKEGIPIIK